MNTDYRFGGIPAVSGAAPAALDPAAIPQLVLGLGDQNWWVRCFAAEALGTIGPPARVAVPDLARATQDRHCPVRSAVAAALGSIGPEARSAVPALKILLNDWEKMVRIETADALWKVARKSKLIVPLLVGALRDEDPFFRGLSARILAEIGPGASKAAPALLEALEDADKWVRFDVIRALHVVCRLIAEAVRPGGVAVVGAAVPGQGGLGHVHLEPHSYWIAKFESLGLQHDQDETDRMVRDIQWHEAHNECWWFSRNAHVYRKPNTPA